MKTQSKNLLNPLSRIDVKNITSQVKETLAMGLTANITPTFSTADLWNIQRNFRTTISRRRYL